MTRSLQGPGRDNETDPFASLVRDIADLRRRIDDSTAQVLRMAGLRAEPGALLVEGALNVTGPMTVGGTLSLPAGIIDNDALANPVAVASPGWAHNNGYALPTAAGQVVQASITFIVPSGFTQALIYAGVTDTGVNSTTSAASMISKLNISGTSGQGFDSAAIPAGSRGFCAANWAMLLTGLSGGSVIVVSSSPYASNATWAANSYNQTTLNAFCIFLR